MATYTGKDGAVSIGDNAVAAVESFSLNQTVDEVESTVMGATYKSFITTFTEWTADCNVYWDPTDTTGQGGLTPGASVTLKLYPIGNVESAKYFEGAAVVTSLGVEVPLGGMISRAVSFRGTGALTEKTVSGS